MQKCERHVVPQLHAWEQFEIDRAFRNDDGDGDVYVTANLKLCEIPRQKKEMANCRFVDAYLSVLQGEWGENEVLVIPSFWTGTWRDVSEANLAQLRVSFQSSTRHFMCARAYGAWNEHAHNVGIRLIVFPFNIDEHWFLLVANIEHHRIELYDSLGVESEEEENDISRAHDIAVQLLCEYVQFLFPSIRVSAMDLYLNSPYGDCTAPFSKQRDLHSCGFFMLLYARCYFFNAPMRFTYGDVKRVRDVLTYEIFHSRLVRDQHHCLGVSIRRDEHAERELFHKATQRRRHIREFVAWRALLGERDDAKSRRIRLFIRRAKCELSARSILSEFYSATDIDAIISLLNTE